MPQPPWHLAPEEYAAQRETGGHQAAAVSSAEWKNFQKEPCFWTAASGTDFYAASDLRTHLHGMFPAENVRD